MDGFEKNAPDLLFVLGSASTRAAIKRTSEVPIVATLVLGADEVNEVSNATGVVLQFPVSTSLKWLKRMLPARSTVGVLYDPEINQKTIDAAEKAAQIGRASCRERV